jgi:hypothetical protein
MRRFTRHWFVKTMLLAALASSVISFQVAHVAAACTDAGFGVVSGLNVTVASADAGSYRVWSRMQVPSASSTYLLEVDGSCYTIGNNLATNQWVWTDKQSSGTSLNLNLAAGTHAIRLLGTSDNVLLDRLILTKDTTSSDCNPPTGTGDACVNAVTLILGDTNGSGTVTIIDLNAVINHWGLTGQTRANGDLTGDGNVTISDLNQVLNNWTR